MTAEYRDRSNKNYRERQRGKIATLEAENAQLFDICEKQQLKIDRLDQRVAQLELTVTELKARALAYDTLQDDYDELERLNRKQAAEIEELKARLGVD